MERTIVVHALVPLIIIVLVVVAMVYFNRKVHFECPTCGCLFKVSGLTFVSMPHMMGARLLTCPNCHTRAMMNPIRDDKE